MRSLALCVVVWASAAHAQPVTQTDALQALANLLDAYDKVPSPKRLLEIAATLREMGRLDDAANTYERYLVDPAADGVAEIKQIRAKLDEELTVLRVRVAPPGAELSIDGGPFVMVGNVLLTRVRPGIHMVRIKQGETSDELAVNGFPGEVKEVSIGDKVPLTPDALSPVVGWLITGTPYIAADGGRVRRVRSGFTGPEVMPIVPASAVNQTDEPREPRETTTIDDVIVQDPSTTKSSSGIVAGVRIDGKGRGFAGGLGLAYTPVDAIELELAALKSDVWGAYAGVRYRFLTGGVRPYAAVGLPLFFFTDAPSGVMATSKVGVGGRVAGGIELVISDHFSVAGDLGIEHFFNVGETIIHTSNGDGRLEETVFVPTLGVIGRL